MSMVLYLKYLFPSGTFAVTCFTFKSSWIISVELAIGPEEGISYLTDKGCNVSVLWTSLGSGLCGTHLLSDLIVDKGESK